MFSSISSWIKASRPHTLPLSLAGIVLAGFIAIHSEKFNSLIFGLALLTAVLLQILANFANDLGDFMKGTDNRKRTGPERMLQSGKISTKSITIAILIMSVLGFCSGSILVYLGTKTLPYYVTIAYYIVGILAILAALTYTLGKNPYGYVGLGDFFVFVFFGLISVAGSYILITQNFEHIIILPTISIGFLSVGVINLNNIRDYQNDKISGKKTLVVLFGIRFAKFYHTFLIIGTIVCTFFWVIKINFTPIGYKFLFLLIIPFFFLIKNFYNVLKISTNKILIRELKHLSIATFTYSLILGISLIL